MANTNNFFSLAQLAEAAYADFGNPKLSLKEALLDKDKDGKNQGFSDTQADLFLADWSVIHHQPDTGSGFSATLFKSKDGEYVLAMRGTAGLLDLVRADFFEIATNGLALRQIVDMYNYWQRLIALPGAKVREAVWCPPIPLSPQRTIWCMRRCCPPPAHPSTRSPSRLKMWRARAWARLRPVS